MIAFGNSVVIFLVLFVDYETLLTVVVPPTSKLHLMLYSLVYLMACLKIDRLFRVVVFILSVLACLILLSFTFVEVFSHFNIIVVNL